MYWPVTAMRPDIQGCREYSLLMDSYLRKTQLLNYTHSSLNDVVERRGWLNLTKQQQTCEIFEYVKNEIVFGYNKGNNIPASRVLLDGFGCCNSKSTLLMALLRICQIPCRFHAVAINRKLNKSAIAGVAYYLTPNKDLYSWVEIYLEHKWVALEGYTFDHIYRQSMGNDLGGIENIALDTDVTNIENKHSVIGYQSINKDKKKLGIIKHYGVFYSPDDFYRQHDTQIAVCKSWLYQHLVRSKANKKLSHTRQCLRRQEALSLVPAEH
jgi:hypothetical protein